MHRVRAFGPANARRGGRTPDAANPSAKKAVVTASVKKPGESDAQGAAVEDCFMIAD